MFRAAWLFVLAFFPAGVFSQHDIKVHVLSKNERHPTVSYEQVEANKLKVVVIDSGVPIGGLTPADFEIRHKQTKLAVAAVEPLLHYEQAKVAVCLCIDNSGSMVEQVPILISTLDNLLNHLGPSAQINAVFFSDEVVQNPLLPDAPKRIRFVDFTIDRAAIRSFISAQLSAKLTPQTLLYDEIYTAIRLMENRRQRDESRFVIVLSDGVDNGSETKRLMVEEKLKENPQLVFYTIDYLQEPNPFLQDLAARSHGLHFRAQRSEELASIFQDITRDIVKLSGYLITYQPPQAIVSGIVTADSSCRIPAGAAVEYFPKDAGNDKKIADVSENGLYEIRLDYPRQWILRAHAPGYQDGQRELDLTAREVYFVDFNLQSAPEFTEPAADSSAPNIFQAQFDPSLVEPEIVVKNTSNILIALELTGPVTRTFQIAPYSTTTFSLVDGAYRYRASAAGLQSLTGESEFRKNYRYTWVFQVVTVKY
jgi:hypothetical protein